jgi:deazaflavin-dependent oxidoreductase (nitroreductase family)
MLPLIYGKAGTAFAVVASKGGHSSHPLWYQNLVAQPEVQVQVAADKFTARARTATADERPELWKTMTEIWPAYDEYQTKTEREIPVVVLERV